MKYVKAKFSRGRGKGKMNNFRWSGGVKKESGIAFKMKLYLPWAVMVDGTFIKCC